MYFLPLYSAVETLHQPVGLRVVGCTEASFNAKHFADLTVDLQKL